MSGAEAMDAGATEAAEAIMVHSHGVAQTHALAAHVASLLRDGDVLLLSGPIGAGKTAFTQGLAAALGVSEDVVSPTFQLQAVYDGRLQLNHFDFYRLGSAREAVELCVEEALHDGGVAVVEWADRFDVVAPPYLALAFTYGAAEDEREISLRPVGVAWQERAASLASWREAAQSGGPAQAGSAQAGPTRERRA